MSFDVFLPCPTEEVFIGSAREMIIQTEAQPTASTHSLLQIAATYKGGNRALVDRLLFLYFADLLQNFFPYDDSWIGRQNADSIDRVQN